MEGSEELRETLVVIRRELDFLRMEATHANLLLDALDSVLCVNGDGNDGGKPFVGVFAALLPVFESSHAIVLVETDDDRGTLECIASNHDALVGSLWRTGRTFTKVLGGRVVTTVAGVDADEWPAGIDITRPGARPALYLPLGVRNRRGLLALLREPEAQGFDSTHAKLARKFSLLGSHAFAATRAHQSEVERHRLTQLAERLEASQAELTYRANHDQLTGLPNRTHIQELVDGILARAQPGHQLALAFIDLDDFKQVNDFYGHAVGDALLTGVATRVRRQIRSTDLIGRISGDEFVVLLDPFERYDEVAGIVNRVRERVQEPFEIDGMGIRVSASLGVAFFPAHGRDYDSLRRNADTAMYQAKTTTKGTVAFFDRTLGTRVAEQMALEHRLRAALHARQFRHVLQSKVDIRTGRVVGFEVLTRWVNEQGDVHAPGRFLAVASNLGLLDGMTNLVFDALLADLPRLDAHFGSDVTYSINVSAAQAASVEFMEAFLQRVADTGRPRNFTIELTEDAIVAAGPFQSRIFPRLREVGIGVAIDDFGTGFSSLAILADITADELKVDRTLISSIHRRPRSQSILRAIESLSMALGMYVVAEGVETTEERNYLLSSTGIACGQGYLFHRPQFVDDLIASCTPAADAPRMAGVPTADRGGGTAVGY